VCVILSRRAGLRDRRTCRVTQLARQRLRPVGARPPSSSAAWRAHLPGMHCPSHGPPASHKWRLPSRPRSIDERAKQAQHHTSCASTRAVPKRPASARAPPTEQSRTGRARGTTHAYMFARSRARARAQVSPDRLIERDVKGSVRCMVRGGVLLDECTGRGRPRDCHVKGWRTLSGRGPLQPRLACVL
jgi:hypothetical protein